MLRSQTTENMLVVLVYMCNEAELLVVLSCAHSPRRHQSILVTFSVMLGSWYVKISTSEWNYAWNAARVPKVLQQSKLCLSSCAYSWMLELHCSTPDGCFHIHFPCARWKSDFEAYKALFVTTQTVWSIPVQYQHIFVWCGKLKAPSHEHWEWTRQWRRTHLVSGC